MSDAPPVRIAVAGAGLIGRKHIGVLRSGDPAFCLAGVADPAPEAAAEGARLGYPVHESLGELLERAEPDAVVVALPNALHVEAALACVERRLPVLVEKPIAPSVEEALALVEAAEAAGVPVLVGHHRRHNPIMRRAAELVREGAIGRVVAAEALYLSHKPRGYHDVAWRRERGGGVVLINAIHEIDCLRMLLGDVETVHAVTSAAVRGFEVEDTAAAVLRFEDGALGTLLCSDTASSPWSWEWGSQENPDYPHDTEDSLRLAGTLGSLAVPSLVHRWHEPGAESWHTPLTARRHTVPLLDAHHEQLRNLAAVTRGLAQPVVDGRSGLLTLATTLAISRSAETGAAVRVADLVRR